MRKEDYGSFSKVLNEIARNDMSTPELQRVEANTFDPNTFDINLSTIDELDDIDDEEISGKILLKFI